MTCKEALSWLKDKGLSNIIMETKCLNLYNRFNRARFDFSYIGLVVKACYSLFENIIIKHIR